MLLYFYFILFKHRMGTFLSSELDFTILIHQHIADVSSFQFLQMADQVPAQKPK